MRLTLVAFPITALAFVLLDAIWLSLMAERLYRPALGHLLLEQFALAPALAFYPIYLIGVLVFAVAPGLQAQRWGLSLRLGALLGLVAYATYDLTNQATLKGWPWHLTLADLCWGSFVTATSAALGCRCAPTLDRLLPGR